MNPFRKGLAIGVVLLFIGLAFAPSINANAGKEELVDFTTEVCGLNGGKQTVKLTQQQADEVEVLFDSIRKQLNATESREEAEEIFKDAVVALDKYGLLGGLSVKQAQRLLYDDLQNNKIIDSIEKSVRNIQDNNDFTNSFCFIIAKVKNSIRFNWFLIFFIWVELLIIELNLPMIIWEIIAPLIVVFSQVLPFGFLSPLILIKECEWFYSIGLEGIKESEGWLNIFFGFTGFKISTDFDKHGIPIESWYIGFTIFAI